jgi:hypothetical protein
MSDTFLRIFSCWCPSEVLKMICLYCPEGPFLWEGAHPKAFLLYYQFSIDELAFLFRSSEWLLGDFIPENKANRVAKSLSKYLHFDSGVALMYEETESGKFILQLADGAGCEIFADPSVESWYCRTLLNYESDSIIANALELWDTKTKRPLATWKSEYRGYSWNVDVTTWPSSPTSEESSEDDEE